MHRFLRLLFLLSLLSLSSSQPHHLHHPSNHLRRRLPPPQPPTESIEPTLPPPVTSPPPPDCILSILRHSFAYTYGQPPVTVSYSPPASCLPPWSNVVLHLAGEISGEQYDRIAAVWLSGAEILRTSTPEPAESGTFWNVQKDVTRYASLFEQSNGTVSMMLENLVNDEFTGVYHVNLTLLFYEDWGRRLGCRDLGEGYEKPADLVIPVADDDGGNGFWFRIENESHFGTKMIKIPINSNRVMLELYVSFHGDDEFWYSNPPTSYLEANNLPTKRGNGAFREVFVRIDGNVVASDVPFPVIFTGGINPLFWEPVVAIGAFDLPSYEFDLTPFLGFLLDGKTHKFELGVANAIGFWLIDANLHVWLDKNSSKVEAGIGSSHLPEFKESWKIGFKQLDGSFEVQAERKSHSLGWVSSGLSNTTTSIVKKMSFKNTIKFERNGTYKTVEQNIETNTEVKVVSNTGSLITQKKLEATYPLSFITSTLALGDENSLTTNLSHALNLREESSNSQGKLSRSIHNSQESGGSMLVKDHSVISGASETRQSISYRDGSGCFKRSVYATGGKVVQDDSAFVCSSHFNGMIQAVK